MRHEMKLNNSPFVSIKNKTKTIELRLNDDKRQKINVGDEIEFINNMTSEKLLVDVVNLHRFDSFSELYKHFDKILLGYDESELADVKDMEEYYSKEEQEKHGVLGIEIKVVSYVKKENIG